MSNLLLQRVFKPLLLLAFINSGVAVTALADEPAADQVSTDGLTLVEKDSRGEIYTDPDVDWSVYTEIRLEDASVAFRRNWQRDQNRTDPFKVKTKDMEEIKADLSEQFREVFTEELTANGGYTMVDASGPNVLTIKPAIVDLDIAAPDTMSANRTMQYTESSGKMTLKLELFDSVTGDLLATASDRREAPRRGYLQWTTSVTNRADANRILRQWAEGLRTRLDEARGKSMES